MSCSVLSMTPAKLAVTDPIGPLECNRPFARLPSTFCLLFTNVFLYSSSIGYVDKTTGFRKGSSCGVPAYSNYVQFKKYGKRRTQCVLGISQSLSIVEARRSSFQTHPVTAESNTALRFSQWNVARTRWMNAKNMMSSIGITDTIHKSLPESKKVRAAAVPRCQPVDPLWYSFNTQLTWQWKMLVGNRRHARTSVVALSLVSRCLLFRVSTQRCALCCSIEDELW